MLTGIGGGGAPTQLHSDSVHSSVLFKMRHLGLCNFYGRFNKVEGKISFDPDTPISAQIEVTIPVESVDTNYQVPDRHLAIRRHA